MVFCSNYGTKVDCTAKFYSECGAPVSVTATDMTKRQQEYAGKTPPEYLNNWILHAEIEICGTNFWFADDVQSVTNGTMIRLAAIVPTAKEVNNIFEMLSDRGYVTLQPVESFYSTFHASVTDRFGVNWNIVDEESPNK